MLGGAQVAASVDGGMKLPPGVASQCCFAVATRERRFVLAAKSLRERQEWVSAITSAQERARILRQASMAVRASMVGWAIVTLLLGCGVTLVCPAEHSHGPDGDRC